MADKLSGHSPFGRNGITFRPPVKPIHTSLARLFVTASLALSGRAQLTIGASGITNTSTSDYVVTSNVTLGANQTWNAQSGDIVVSGNINGNYKVLTVTGANDTTLSGAISNLTYSNGLTKSGSGTLFLDGNNSLGGTVNLQGGTTQLSHNNALGGSTWGNTVQSGAALALSGGITVNEGSFNIAGSGTGSGSLINVSGNNTLSASLTLTGDSLFTSQQDTFSLSQSISQANYDLTLTGAGNWNVSGQINGNSSATLSLTADGNTTISGSVNVSGGVVIDNNGTTSISSNLNLGNGALTIQGNSDATLTGSQVNANGGLTISDNASANISNTPNLGGGDLTLDSAGLIALSRSQLNVGNILLSGSGSTTFDTQINATSFTQTAGTSTFSGTGNNYFASVSIEGGTVIAEQDGVAFFTNDLTIDNANIEFGADSQIPAWTTVTLQDNVTLFLNGTSQAFDELIITGNSVIDFGGGNASLLIGQLSIDSSAVLTILNWSEDNLDVFNADVDPDSSTPNMQFGGGGGGAWDPVTGNIIPVAVVPERRAYGLLLMAASLTLWTIRRPRRPTAAARQGSAPVRTTTVASTLGTYMRVSAGNASAIAA